MNDETRDYLRMLYEENAEHARAHEDLRAQATIIFMALIAGAFTLVDKKPVWIGWLIFVVSLLGHGSESQALRTVQITLGKAERLPAGA